MLLPGCSKDLYVVVLAQADVMERLPGPVAYLQVLTGQEILRRRFRKLKNKEVLITYY